MNKKISKADFAIISKQFPNVDEKEIDYLYDVYDMAYDGLIEAIESTDNSKININSLEMISYILGEFIYSTSLFNEEDKTKFMANENFKSSMASVSADKYLSLSKFNHRENKFTNAFLPPVSSFNLYINLMLNIVSTYPRRDPKNTLIVDLLTKTLSISRSIISLLCDGYETEAFAIWRTLHECECTLILLDKYGDLAINSYLKHMRYGLAYKGTFENKEEESELFQQMKSEMAEISLKSKDIKKYIEYGWLLAIPESKNIENFKLNFRDGLETLAGLHQYAKLYMTSSEILHSTPLLIYSNEQYFYYLTLLNLYESFFRFEKVFTTLFLSRVGEEGREKYMEMRRLYYSQLVNIHRRESLTFNRLHKSKKKDAQ